MTRRRKPRCDLTRESLNQLLALQPPWEVVALDVVHEEREVRVHISHDGTDRLVCPACGCQCPGSDHRERRWRHLDTLDDRTYLVCDVPRVVCPEPGVMTVTVPWSERLSRFTVGFEALVIDWLREASVSAVRRLLGVSWTALDRIKPRAVVRGLARREEDALTHVCVDETSFKKRPDDVTVVSDSVGGKVIYVGEGRWKGTLDDWYRSRSDDRLRALESVSMDMGPASITSTRKHVPDGDKKIAFDRFHVVRKVSEAVDKVRRQEHKTLLKQGMHDLKGTKYHWLTTYGNMTPSPKHRFRPLRASSLKTSRAWALKAMALSLWR